MKNILLEKRLEGRLQIYKRSKSGFQGKIYLGCRNNRPIYKYKSIRTEDQTFAIKELEKWFFKINYELENNITTKEEIGQNRFIKFVEEYLNEVDWQNNISHQNDGRFAKRLLQWIKDEKIKEITFASLTQYKEDYLPRFTKSSNTVAHYINFIRKVYRHQRKKGTIVKTDVPEFPVLSKSAGRRTYFTFSEYRKLIKQSIERMNDDKLARNAQLVRKTLNRFIIFMIGSGLRSDEAYNLTWDQIEFRKNKDNYFCRLDLSKSKTGPRQVTTKPQCVNALKQLKSVYAEYSDVFEKNKWDNNKVFPFHFHSSFRNLLKSCDLYEDKSINKKRDIKSCRQTYISWAVIKGENVFDLAKNCGNSVAVIEKYYTNNLTSKDFEERLSSLQIIK